MSIFKFKEYTSVLGIYETEVAIKLIKADFEARLSEALCLTRISAPLFVTAESGLNDNLNGVERPVSFDILAMGKDVQIVHSLAKWKRTALYRYGFKPDTGLYTDMNAIRRDETPDCLHSFYVDQWDWEKVITRDMRCREFIIEIVNKIVGCMVGTQDLVCEKYPELCKIIGGDTYVVTSSELEEMYPEYSPKERENIVCREHGTVFLMEIGGPMKKSGKRHDGRAPDYDDWSLNGDILVWYEPLDRAVELSSMGIRVDEESLHRQLKMADCEERENLPFHRSLLDGMLPLTIGGGIGQSRLCMVLLNKVHIGEVQCSVWPDEMLGECEIKGVSLL